MINRNDEAAFPVPIGQTDERQWGMSLHDWFMGQALQGLLADSDTCGSWTEIAVHAKDIADAMLEARKDKKEPDSYEARMSRTAHIYQWASTNGLENHRACNTLARAGIDSFDKITISALSEVRNCGEKTVAVIMEWKARKEAKQ